MKKAVLLFGIILVLFTIIMSIFVSVFFLAMVFLFFPLSILYTEQKSVDEREKFIRYKAGYLTLHLTIFLFVILFIQEALSTGESPQVIYYLLLIFPSVVYTFSFLSQRIDLARSGRIVLYVFGGWWIIFSLLSHGFTISSLIESPIGFGYLIVAFLSYRWKRLAGIIALIYGLFLLARLTGSFRDPQLSTALLVLIPLPLFFSGIVFLKKDDSI